MSLRAPLLLLLSSLLAAADATPCSTPSVFIRGELVTLTEGAAVAQVQILGSPIHGVLRPEDVVFETGPKFRVLLVHGVKQTPPKTPRVWVLDRRPEDKALTLCRILPDLPPDGWKREEKKEGSAACSRSCRFGATCVRRGGREVCECAFSCPADYRPVCGSDAVTYSSRCAVTLASCQSRRRITVVSEGECKSASACSLSCRFGATCTVQRSGREVCECAFSCPADYRPVCGSDAVTYKNECHMRAAACTEEKEVRLKSHGTCSATGNGTDDLCKALSCPHPFHTCRVVRGRAQCRCPTSCSGARRGPTLCGSDGITYRSPCRLRRLACRAGKDVHMLYQGACSLPQSCLQARVPCGPRGICQRDWTSRLRCLCPTCHGIAKDLLGSRVCASDGNTWPSECHVRAEACAANRDLRILHEGPCDLCKRKKCNFYARCHVDHRGQPECVCPTSCPKVMKPICASNGRTFDSSCVMKVEACMKQQNLTEIDQKPCAKCSKDCPVGTFCLHGQCRCREKCPGLRMPVCGQDGQLYRTECDLGRAACLQKRTIEIDPSGKRCQPPENKPLQDQVAQKPEKTEKTTKKRMGKQVPKIETKKPVVTEESTLGVTLTAASSVTLPPYEIMRRYFSLELHLIPNAMDGHLVFLGPKDAKTSADMLSLSLIGGHIVYKFDLGSGPLVLRSQAPLLRRKLNRVLIIRKGRQGRLTVNGKTLSGRSAGRLRGFNIRPSHKLVIGQVKERAWTSFDGCILLASLVGHRPAKSIDLLDQMLSAGPPSQLSIRRGCPLSKCSPNPCQHGGRCNTTDNVQITCTCKKGWRGARCEKEILSTRFQTPSFDGNSFITIPPSLLKLKKRRMDLEVWFLSSSMNGLVLQLSGWRSQHFLRVEVINGWLQASCRTGLGTFVIRSQGRIPIGEWVQLKVRKTRRFVIMTANEKLRSKLRIISKSAKKLPKAQRRRMNVFRVEDASLFVGGAPNNPLDKKPGNNWKVWLKGGVQRVFVNRRLIDLYGSGVKRSPKIGIWRGPPCSPLQARCGAGHVCEPRLNSARCVCLQPPCSQNKMQTVGGRNRALETSGFLRDEAVQAINFNGYSLFRMKNRGRWQVKRSLEDNVVVKLKTSDRNGLVLIVTDGKKPSPADSFFLLAVRHGYPEVAWNLGGPHCLIRIRGPKPISDNRWHELHALRNQGLSTLLVDGYPVSGQLNCTRKKLHNDGWMWLGGYNSFIKEFPIEYNQGFMGCIQHLIVDTEEMSIRDLAVTQRGEMKPCAVPFEF